MYIIVGIVIILFILVLFLADKIAPSSAFMSSFKKGTYEKLMIGLTIAAILSLSYGIYHKVTYQLPFLDIQISEGSYTVFGDIGEIGYYADSLVKENQQIELHLVSWEELNLEKEVDITIQYPSGKEEDWNSSITLIEQESTKNVNSKYGIKEIYELEPFTFSESGEVDLIIAGDKEFTIEVKKDG